MQLKIFTDPTMTCQDGSDMTKNPNRIPNVSHMMCTNHTHLFETCFDFFSKSYKLDRVAVENGNSCEFGVG